MNNALLRLASEVHALMRGQADALGRIEDLERASVKERDALLRDVLDVIDSVDRAGLRLTDSEARETANAIAAQARNALEAQGLTVVAFARGDTAPLELIQVVGTISDPSLPDLAVAKTLHIGLTDRGRVIRKAGVEINQLQGGR